jgi:regulator of replication initiation timing
MSAYTEIEKMIIEFNTQVLSLAQQNQDLKVENESLRAELAYNKREARKYHLLTKLRNKKLRGRPIDMHDVWPGDDEILKDIELKRVK